MRSIRPAPALVGVLLCLLAVGSAAAEMIFEDDFESLHERWRKNINGAGSIEIAPGGVEGNCLKIHSDGGLAYFTTNLDPEKHAGTTLEVRGMVKLDDVKMGPQTYSTAKFHFGQVPRGQKEMQHAAARWVGTTDWTERVLRVDIEDEAGQIVLDLGIQNGTGTMYVDNLVVRDTFGTGRPISLRPVANRGRSDGVAGDGKGSFLDTGMNDLFALPAGNLEAPGVTFYLPNHGDNGGQTCVILEGKERPDYPAETEPVPVSKRVGSLHFLHAAAWANAADKEPTLTYEIAYADGEKATLEVRAGVEVGNFDDPRGSENWKLVWEGENGAGRRVGVGMTQWQNPRPDVAVKSLQIKSAGNGVPIVLAISYRRPQR